VIILGFFRLKRLPFSEDYMNYYCNKSNKRILELYLFTRFLRQKASFFNRTKLNYGKTCSYCLSLETQLKYNITLAQYRRITFGRAQRIGQTQQVQVKFKETNEEIMYQTKQESFKQIKNSVFEGDQAYQNNINQKVPKRIITQFTQIIINFILIFLIQNYHLKTFNTLIMEDVKYFTAE
ncbi:hypothetical protein pb186bvf_020806, partial [Paramecium bursaria]